MKPRPKTNATEERIKVIERELPMWERKLHEALQYEREADQAQAHQMVEVYHRHAKNILERIERYKLELHALKSS
jgi:F0F1-type ATP synthase membrane subunit b/b'